VNFLANDEWSMNEEIVLGLSLSHNSAAAFVRRDYEVVFASSEERVFSEYNENNFIKNTKHFPVGAISAGLHNRHIQPHQVKVVAWSNYEDPDLYHFVFKSLSPQLRELLLSIDGAAQVLEKAIKIKSRKALIAFRQQHDYEAQLAFVNSLIGFILEALFDIRPEKIMRVDHHLCHAYGALKTSGFTDGAMVITLDGFGDNVAGRTYMVKNDKLVCLPTNTIPAIGSPGLFYQYVTGYMRLQDNGRLRMLRDEYKLLGLEPYATREYDYFEHVITNKISPEQNQVVWSDEVMSGVDDSSFYASHPIKAFRSFTAVQENLDQALQQAQQAGFTEFDVARAVQKKFEAVVLKWIKTAIQPYTNLNLALSGGAFYNVKLNYQIKQLNQVHKLWIFPAAGDEGNSLGAAYFYLAEHNHAKPYQVSHFYFGSCYRQSDILEAIQYIKNRFKTDLHFQPIVNETEKLAKITDLLVNRKIVHLANTKMGVEFGPRALMVRSTLSPAISRTANETIQRLFQRYQYMPLAPVMKMEHAQNCLIGFESVADRDLSKYMIVAYPCKNEFARQYPAIVNPYHPEDAHKYGVSFSTRPQLVSFEDYPLAWNLLDMYEQKTGEIALINTSFNSHHSPILGNIVLLLLDWLSMKGESYLFLGDYFFDYASSSEMMEIVGKRWVRAKNIKAFAYEASKAQLMS
jgi:carbamoyltransferase